MIETPFFSIIIPVYNAENSISELVKSIQKQRFSNFEMLLIDDGSEDNTFKTICDAGYSDSRIQAFTKKNGGASSARNFGMENAKGKYLLFFDADDSITEDLLEIVFNKIQSGGEADGIVFFGKINVLRKSEIVSVSKCSDVSSQSINAELFERLLVNNMLPTTCNKAVKRKFVGNLKFKDMSVGEDYSFYLDLIERRPIISIIAQPLYIYNIDSTNSIMQRYHEDRLGNFIIQKKQINRILRQMSADEMTTNRINNNNNADVLSRIVTNVFRKQNSLSFFGKYRELLSANKSFVVDLNKISSSFSRAERLKLFLTVKVNFIKFFFLWILYKMK